MLEINEYNLPDSELIKVDNRENALGKYIFWIPEKTMVIVGYGSDIEKELNIENINKDKIPVLKRYSGGCSVIISPNMYAISMVLYNRELKDLTAYFKQFNNIIIKTLNNLNINNVQMKGISDLTINNLKISGSSIYRNKDIILFHIIINVGEDMELLEKYLLHPPREPKYRENRTHKDFVTSLKLSGYNIDVDKFKKELDKEWKSYIKTFTI